MKTIYITYRSLTAAQKARKELSGRGVRSELIRTPKRLQETGCGFSLRLSERDYRKAIPLPDGYSRVFAEDGKPEAGGLLP